MLDKDAPEVVVGGCSGVECSGTLIAKPMLFPTSWEDFQMG